MVEPSGWCAVMIPGIGGIANMTEAVDSNPAKAAVFMQVCLIILSVVG